MRNIGQLSSDIKTATLFVVVFISFNCFAQSPPTPSPTSAPAFEVASVRLSGEESKRWQGRRIQTEPGSLTTHGLTLRACILWAYQIPAQIIGPDWLSEVSLDIVAKAATPVSEEQLYLMLRTLLAERLGVKAHFERREMPVYALTISKGGPKFSESKTEGPLVVGRDKGAQIIQRASMRDLAAQLSGGLVDRPVVDATGLKGHYDIRIDLAAVADINQQDRMDATSAMIAALQEQMGLKIEARKDEVDVLVIDHAEKTPTEN
jgi:uncharacterized protein (TIGR03435 family)